MVSTMTSAEQVKIPEGYKQTEVGVIPEDWSVAPLNEICDFGGGTTPPRAQHERYFINGSNNWVKTTDLNNSLIGDSEEQITDLAVSETGLKLHPIGSVLVAMYGGFNQIGRTGYITRPSAINQALVAIKPKSKKLESYYLLSQLNYNVGYWKGVASSSRKDPNITSNDVKNYPLAFPLVKEQTAIANALSDVDNLIASLETLVAKKNAIKTAAMQQLLTGKKRLPAFVKESEEQGAKQSSELDSTRETAQTAHTKQTTTLNSDLYKESSEGLDSKSNQYSEVGNANNKQTAPRPGYKLTELGEIPEDWEVVGLGYLFEDKVIRKRISVQDDVTFIGMQDVSESAKISNSHKVKYSDVKSGFTYFERNDVLVAKITPCFENGKGAFTDVLETDVGFGSTEFHVLRATSTTDSKYLYYFTNTVKFRKELEGEMVGSAGHRRVPLSSIQTYQVAISKNKEEQTAIANVLSDMDTDLDSLQQRLSKTQKIKQGMMQELLTGKTRLV